MAEQKSNTVTIVLAILGILLLSCCGVGGYFGYKTYYAAKDLISSAVDAGKDTLAVNNAATEFTSDLAVGDTEKAYDLTSTNFKSKYKTAKDFKDFVDKHKELKGPFSGPQITIGSEGKPPTVAYPVSGKTVKLTLVKDGDKFKIDDVSVDTTEPTTGKSSVDTKK
jgi:hypothetical protein